MLREIEQRLPLTEQQRSNFPPHLSAASWDCLREMVMPDSKRRASVEDCLCHPWLGSEAPLQLTEPMDPLKAALLPGSDAIRLDTECPPVRPLRTLTAPLRAPSSPALPRLHAPTSPTLPRLHAPSSPAPPRPTTTRTHAPKLGKVRPMTARLSSSPDHFSLTGPARRPFRPREGLLSPALILPPTAPTLAAPSAHRSSMTSFRDLHWKFPTQVQLWAGSKRAMTLPLICTSPLMTSCELVWPQVPLHPVGPEF